MAHNNEAPNQPPRVDAEAGHRGSTIKVYNIAQFAGGISDEPMRVYTEGNLPGEMKQASLVTQMGDTDEGDLTLAMEFTLALDGMTKGSTFLGKLQAHMLADAGTHNSYTVERAYYANALSIRTVYGLSLLARFDHSIGQLVISNQMRLSAEGEEEISVTPTPLSHSHVGADVQLIEMGRVMADILTYEPSDPEAYRGWPQSSKGCLIEIGKTIRALPSPADRAALGRRAVTGVRWPESTSQEADEFDPDAVRLSDIGGHEAIKETFAEIALILKKPDIAQKWKIRPPRGVLLYGRPGTGKTMLAQALATELGAEVCRIQGNDIYGKYVGDSERNIQKIFDDLNEGDGLKLALWDEFDASVSVPERVDSGGDHARNAVSGIFKQQMELLRPGVLVVAITNELERIPEALRRAGRFDYKIHVPMPDQYARLAIMGSILSKYITFNEAEDNSPGSDEEPIRLESSLFDNAIDWNTLARVTDGMSGAQISEVFRRITQKKALEEMRTGHVAPVTQDDFTRTIAAMQRDNPA